MFAFRPFRGHPLSRKCYIDNHQYNGILSAMEQREAWATAEQTIIIEPRRTVGSRCCEPGLRPRLSDERARTGADLLKALADPARLQILDILSQHTGSVCVCDLEGVVGLPDGQTGQRPKQATISHHLKVLREAGLVGFEKHGLWAYYFVQRDRLAEAQQLLALLG
jgi:ArsR family transcriptional regulator, arsenate/arsenite/antimonite-responsive transcriptional repressor